MSKIFGLLMCFVMSVCGMENANNNNNNNNYNYKQWVVAAHQVRVRNLQLNTTLDITDQTTVADIKNALFDREGIPTAQQKILATWNDRNFIWSKTMYSPELADYFNIKDVMNQYDTDTLQLWLKLRSTVAQPPARN